MIYLADVRDWLKSYNIAEHCYIGKLDNKNEKSIGVYPRKGDMKIALGGIDNTKTAIKRVSILLHWNKNANETERRAIELQKAILNTKSLTLNDKKVNYIRLLCEEPIDVGTDDSGVYERVIEMDIYYERRRT